MATLSECRPSGPHTAAAAQTDGTGSKTIPRPKIACAGLSPGARKPGCKPITALRACHDSQGLRINARTACAGWLGERLNVGWAIDVLHPLAVSARPCLAKTLNQSPAGVSTPAGG